MPYAIEVSLTERHPQPQLDDTELHIVVERVRRDHRALRGLLDEVEQACDIAKQVSERRCEALRDTVWDLYIAFNAHLALEEAYLAPILRSLDAWGELRAATMLNSHTEQRRAILEIVEGTHYQTKAVSALVVQALALLVLLRADMEDEEATLADAEREPDVVADQEDG
ncbi:MAG: hypothetical protein JWP87_1179 [Labilithrix sp.]|nr:hypothetical protein [Labilithrix sp.]